MAQLVISTIGTSLLTNQIDRDIDPDTWLSLLEETANYTADEIKKYHQNVANVINELAERAEDKLSNEKDIAQIREISAELNGIYGLYEGQLEKGKLDTHWLITTDTAQGQKAAELIHKYLKKKVNFVQIFTPEKLSTLNTQNFSQGIDDLLDWIDKKVKEHQKQKDEIYFNLVGGFKAFQGCMNTIGMFYANKIIYLFEGKGSRLITIPRLPITVDKSKLKDHVTTLTLLNAGAALSRSQIEQIPEALVAEVERKFTMSNWGQLIWNQCKDEFLSQDLIDFPRIQYEGSFKKDYKDISNPEEKVKLQETIAKVSYLLEESNGDTRDLAKAVSYYAYNGAKDKEGVDHFYVGIHFRVSCKLSNGKLTLRHYGTHNHVQRKELR